jgi:hypothetical protein
MFDKTYSITKSQECGLALGEGLVVTLNGQTHGSWNNKASFVRSCTQRNKRISGQNGHFFRFTAQLLTQLATFTVPLVMYSVYLIPVFPSSRC